MLHRDRKRAPKVPSELREALPCAWVHIPKCGSSFINTLIHLPTVCKDDIPSDFVVDSHLGPFFLSEFRSMFDLPTVCPGLLTTRFGHDGIEEDVGYDHGKGHFMTMLRQPEQRIMSAYLDMLSAALFEEPETLLDNGRSWGGWNQQTLPTLEEYAKQSSGCAVRMLTRGGQPCGAHGGPPSDAEVALAKQRLHEGFAFVGLTDKWELSMCLFNAMFHTGCHSWQFGSSRPSNNADNSTAAYDLTMLNGVTDPYDGALYAEAEKIFEKHLKQYNVSEASCAPCWNKAGLSLVSIGKRVVYEDERASLLKTMYSRGGRAVPYRQRTKVH
mmetsp:Transcript_31992/g.86732  ORF Transcript_31992/g.86732 Transcript_31992/m.86732 type:complete len:328 (-) Transcript_31992:37-1020(-)